MLVRTALLAFVAGTVSLVAQNTDATDTAPGGATAPPVVPQVTAAPPSPGLGVQPSGTPPPSASTAKNLIPNGTFQTDSSGSGAPDGWKLASGITWEQEGGRHFMRLTQQQPGKLLMLYREVKIPAGTKAIEIGFQYRVSGIQKGAQGWFDARAIFHYLDGTRQQVKPEPRAMTFTSGTWTEVTQKVEVPEGVAMVVLMPSLFQVAAGVLDLAEVRVTPLDSTTATALAEATAAEAQKQAERTATLAAEAALPAMTPEIHVSGNKLVTADGTEVHLAGVNVESLDWSPTGDKLLWTVHVALHDWNANIVRLPVQNSFWFGQGRGDMKANDAEAYRTLIDTAVKLCAANGAYLLLDLHRFLAPDDACAAFWKDAAARYKNNPAVIFDVFNEPHDIPWEVWRNGGMVPLKDKEPFHSPGMQGLVDAVRSTGAKNIVVCGGLEYAFNLSGVLNGFALDDKGGNGIMYATHFYNWHKDWQGHFLGLVDKYPILVGEFGADTKKMNFIPAEAQEDPYTWVPDALAMIQKYHLNYTAFSLHPRSTPVLISDWDYTPTPFWGVFAKDALHGKQFTLTRMR